jgi:glycosyltransferase involved in cell wall biosynthesis
MNKGPATLIIITPGFPKNEEDTACIPPQQVFVKALKELSPGLNIVVLTLQYPFFSGEYYWNGIRVIAFGNKNNSRLYNSFANLKVDAILKKLNNEHQLIGVLSFWFGKCAFIANSFAKRYRVRHYCWILGQDAKAGNKYFSKIKPDGNSLIALSDFIAGEVYGNYGIRPQHIIPVGIDTSLFDSAPPERDIDILGAGSLIPLKQYAIFLDMINRLKPIFPGIKVIICGDGPELDNLELKAAALGIKDNVTFVGELPHKEVLRLMQRSKILLHSSQYEGFGAVCLEALYAGAHVISFVRPMNTIVKNWHIAADEEEMFKLLKERLQSPNLEHTPVLPYTIQANANKLMQLFNYKDAVIS